MTPTPQAERRGFSLVEILVAVTLLACAMMSLAGAAALGLSQMGKARQDLGYSADVQEIADSLVGRGWGNVSTGSSAIRGRPVSWTVSTINPNSQKIDLIVTRRGHAQTNVIYSDTVTLFVAKSRVQ
jgi:prepilin-type N-terminal cleavage/methylation domain-containing protein